MKYLMVLCTVLIFLFSCDSDDGLTESDYERLLAEIATNKQLWLDSEINSYSLHYFWGGYGCPYADQLPSIFITVLDNEIISAYYPDTGYTIPIEDSGLVTVTRAFEIMEAYIEEKPFGFTQEFDANFGFPQKFTVDPNENNECDAKRFMVWSLS